MGKVKERTKKVWQWLRKNALNKQMIMYVLIAEAIFWSPCVVTALLALIVNPWWWTAFGAICAFWAGPFTPAVPLQIGLAVLIKKIVERKKKMNINTSIGLRDRSRITLSNFKGLDTLSAAVDVSAIHATEMKNLISRDGVNHKRFGWKTQFRIRDNCQYLKIQGIFSFTIFHKKFLLAYAGKKFWLIDIENQEKYNITHSAISIVNDKLKVLSDQTSISPVVDDLLLDEECKYYMNGNKVYFIGCGDLLVFSKWNNDKFELRRVVGNEDVYIPTTTENIGSEEDGQHYTRITAEERNILSPYTYNLLFGAEELNDGESLSYKLDCKDFTDIEVEVNESVLLKPITSIYKYKKGDKLEKIKFSLQNVNIVQTKTWEGTLDETEYYTTYRVEILLDDLILMTMKNGDELILQCRPTYYDFEEYQTCRDENGFFISEIGYYCPLYGFGIVCYKKKETGELIRLPGARFSSLYFDINFSIINVTENSITTKIVFKFDDRTYFGDLTQYESIKDNLIMDTTQHDITFFNIGPTILKDDEGKYTGKIDRINGELNLNSVADEIDAYAPLVSDVPNIKVKLTRPYDASIVTSAIKACEFGAQGGTDRLFIVDNTGNTVRWSKDQDFTYFGEKSWCVCGTSDKSITGMDRLNDSTLLIVKEYSPREPSIFIITGNILTGETEAGTIDYTALFTPHGYQVGMGAVGEIINFNGDCLMVAKDGLYAVSLGENMTVDSRYVLHRSRQISNKLEKFDLSNAKCVSFNGKFFVAVGGEEQECYIADNKYTASFDGDIQNVVNYEWWRWTNIPVNVWGFVENELWFGTEDGQLCSFAENFYDETFSRLYTGLATYKVDENEIVGFTLNKDIKVSIGDIFTPTCDFYGGITTDRFECVNGETRFYLPLNDYLENETVYINNNAYTITKQDLYFSIQYSTDSTEITFYRNYKNKPLTVMDEVVVVLKDRDNKFPKWSAVKSQGGLNPSNEEFTATLSHKEPVISKWVSGAMDLGTRSYSKSLTYLVLTGEKDLANRLKYGLKTRFTHRDYELLRANNDLDFTELDLQTVSMDSDFASSYTKKLNIRNINFLMLYFISDTAEDIALNSVQIEFKLYKRNIGVR